MFIIKYHHVDFCLKEQTMCVCCRFKRGFIDLCASDGEINLVSLNKRHQRQGSFEALISLRNIPCCFMILVLCKQGKAEVV